MVRQAVSVLQRPITAAKDPVVSVSACLCFLCCSDASCLCFLCGLSPCLEAALTLRSDNTLTFQPLALLHLLTHYQRCARQPASCKSESFRCFGGCVREEMSRFHLAAVLICKLLTLCFSAGRRTFRPGDELHHPGA